jgi:hypothetical protein
MKDTPHCHPIVMMRGGSTTGRHQRPIGLLTQGAGVRVIIVGVSQDIAYLSGQGGRQLGCDGIVCVLAGVSLAASGSRPARPIRPDTASSRTTSHATRTSTTLLRCQ